MIDALIYYASRSSATSYITSLCPQILWYFLINLWALIYLSFIIPTPIFYFIAH